jgi:nicotinamidase/pyrazinamidase
MDYLTKVPDIIFWNVDTQYDFMRNDESFKGALPIAGAQVIEKNLEKLTKMAKMYDIDVVNTADWHTLHDVEISNTPDFKSTYPQHCMANSRGAEYIPATKPKDPQIISWQDKECRGVSKYLGARNFVLYKNDFDIFKGNPHTDTLLNELNPDMVFVYGVATNVCVDYAVHGLLDRKKKVYVVTDAIKELPNEIAATPLEKILGLWKDRGVELISTKKTREMLETRKYIDYALRWIA